MRTLAEPDRHKLREDTLIFTSKVEYLEQIGEVTLRGDWFWVFHVDRQRWFKFHASAVSYVATDDGPPKMGRPKNEEAAEPTLKPTKPKKPKKGGS